jgi:hypothetical protein
MSDYFYEGKLNAKNSLVIYKYDAPVHDVLLIEGYKAGASLIINGIKNNLQTFHDVLLYPLLNLYVNAIEFLLKKTFDVLKNHHTEGCKFLNKPRIKENNKILKNHNLKLIFNEIEYILQKNPNPHYLELNPLQIIIKDFDKIQLNSISSRYHKNISNMSNALYCKKLNIRIFKLHEDLEKIINSFISYWENESFSLCCSDCYTKEKIAELQNILLIAKKHKSIFERNKRSFDKELFTASNLNFSTYEKDRNEFMEKFHDTPLNELKSLLLFLKIGSNDVTYNAYWEKMNRDYFLGAIYSIKISYENTSKKIQKYIQSLSKYI